MAPNSSTTVAVVGLGLLGRGIATCFLGHGFRVIGCDHTSAAHEIAEAYIERGLREMAEHSVSPPELIDEWRSRYFATTRLDNWPACDFVVESVDEVLAIKQGVFDKIERMLGASVPIGSNTSAIPITQLQESAKHPSRIFGMHWFEPAYATQFLELIPGDYTSPIIMKQAADIARCCDKEPSVLVKDIPGFIVNRLAYAMYREAMYLLETGVADAATIDRSFRNACGVWSTIFGPFQWIDATGGPELYGNAMKRVLPTLSNSAELPSSLLQLISTGAQGVTNGRGFYDYTKEEAKLVDELFHSHAWRAYQMMKEYRLLEQDEHAAMDR